MLIKSDFFKKIENEFKTIKSKERLGGGGNPASNLATKIFYMSKTLSTSSDDLDQTLITEIYNALQSLEDSIVKIALNYQTLAKSIFNQNVNPQKWIDFAQKQATELSYEMYSEDEVKLLRRFYIVWLTWIYCDEEFKKMRILSSRNTYYGLGKEKNNNKYFNEEIDKKW